MKNNQIIDKIESQIQISNIIFPDIIDVCGHSITLDWSNDKLKAFYIKFLKEMAFLYLNSSKKRYVISLCGACGSGKSVFTAVFDNLFKQLDFPFVYTHIGIDSFHFNNEYLLSNYAMDYNGRKQVLKEFKGRHDTYDILALNVKLEEFISGKAVKFPIYSRELHNPIENAISITNPYTLLLIEGNCLYYNKGEYVKLIKQFDYKFFLDSTIDGNKAGVVDRHIKGGRTKEDAENFYKKSDSLHFPYINQSKTLADRILPPFYEIIS